MGLLDDAIREHLDLKRARGGDPAEIERMEREALGPVRREPTIGSTRFEDDPGPATTTFEEPAFHEEHLAELEDLQELGYHDSTAPHPHPHHAHAHPDDEHLEPHLDFDDADAEPAGHEPEASEPPRRRFLRRSRPASLAEPAPLPDPGFHEELPAEDHDRLEHREVLESDEPETPPPARPPGLKFENPPKRPRFSAEPPTLRPESGEPTDLPPDPASAGPTPEAPAPTSEPPEPSSTAQPAPEYEHFDEPEADGPDAQETTEFDVQNHLKQPPAEDEDVLEETPDFLQDTPEHDRLWFEQRPPKDFDFNG